MSAETIFEQTPYGPIAFEPIDCTMCGESIRNDRWTEHARSHNPSAYREGWPCTCRPDRPCEKHRDAPWFKPASSRVQKETKGS